MYSRNWHLWGIGMSKKTIRRMKNVRFRKQVVPGDQVITTAEVIKTMRGSMGIIHCEGKVDGVVACECDCTFVIKDPVE